MKINNLKTPLIAFHKQIIAVGNPLPPTGKSLEVAKRIAIVVAAPFAYLALGLLTLAEKIGALFWNNRAVVPPGPVTREQFTAQKLDEVVGQIMNALQIQGNNQPQKTMRFIVDLTIDNVHVDKVCEIKIGHTNKDELNETIRNILGNTVDFPENTTCKYLGVAQLENNECAVINNLATKQNRLVMKMGSAVVLQDRVTLTFLVHLNMTDLPDEPRHHLLYKFHRPLAV